MAVEMAKLSLWLVTLHKHRPFTFLDHAIKCGDSLLGLHDPAQLERFHLVSSRAQTRVVDYLLREVQQLMAQARARREELERFTALDVRDAELKSRLHREAEGSLVRVRVLADLIVGAALSTAGSNTARSATLLDARLEELLLQAGAALVPPQGERLVADRQDDAVLWPLRQAAEQMLGRANGTPRRPFHWLVEFPEVFSDTSAGGFDALVGNPPFVGGKKITGLFGTDYRDNLVLYLADGRRGSADLCAYFFLRAVQVLRPSGTFGLLAVNTIAEGDTRQVGLEAMLQQGIALYAARPNFEWPGAAAVVACAVHGVRGNWGSTRRINGAVVPTISAFLSAEDEWSPKPLQANAGKSFIGSYVLGMGFTMSSEEAQAYIARDGKNAEVLFPYLNGEDLNSHPQQQASRWVINFWDWPLERSVEDGVWASADERQRETWMREGRVPPDYPGNVAADFPELLERVQRLVKPERDLKNRPAYRDRWWHYAEKQQALYHAIGRGRSFARHPDLWSDRVSMPERLFACSLVSKYLAVGICDPKTVFAHRLAVFALSDWASFALLSSSINDAWARKNSSSLESRLNYSPSDAFDTLPLVLGGVAQLVALGERFYRERCSFCSNTGLGLTDFYNALHDPQRQDASLASLRILLSEIDRALLAAYGWEYLSPEHGFHEVSSLPANDRVRFTISEAARLEVLRRLAALNRQRYQEEQDAAQSLQAALAEQTAPRKRAGRPAAKRTTAQSVQTQLFE
jgi:hypothetical protein